MDHPVKTLFWNPVYINTTQFLHYESLQRLTSIINGLLCNIKTLLFDHQCKEAHNNLHSVVNL